eukprot:s106_g19.t1
MGECSDVFSGCEGEIEESEDHLAPLAVDGSSVSGAAGSSTWNPASVIWYTAGTHATQTAKCNECNLRVSAVGLAAPLALLSIYQASLGEWLVCLRFSPWALRVAPPNPCCTVSALPHGVTKTVGRVVLGTGPICPDSLLAR